MAAERAAIAIGCLLLVAASVRADDNSFEATARVPAPAAKPAASTTFDEREIVTLRESMGDSFNAIESAPGVVPTFSGVPYLLVRGAPPAGTVQYLDGVPVPALFHLALGPSIAHPAMIGSLDFYPGVAPARYGRHSGGVFSQTAAQKPAEHTQGEVGLRLLDAEALLLEPRTSELAVHGRIGYPRLMLAAIGSDAVLGYWDYHATWNHALSSHDRASVTLFGAYDRVGEHSKPADDIALQFHRALARLTHVGNGYELGSSVYVGYEQGVLGQELTARSLRIGPEIYTELALGKATHLRLGADLEAKLAQLDRGPGTEPVSQPQPTGMTTPNGIVPTISGGGFDLQTQPIDFIDQAPLRRIAARNAGGAYAELTLAPVSAVEVQAGARSDIWFAAGRQQTAADERLLVRVRALPKLQVHAAFGTTHQAASSPLPIPGLTDFELDYGLQSALQSETGATFELPGKFTLSATGFYHHYAHLVFLELILDCEGNTDPIAPFANVLLDPSAQPLCKRSGLPRGDGNAYGFELWLKRSLAERLTGWLSYTLGWANARAADRTPFAPQFDVRHQLSLVVRYDFGAGFEAGARVYYRSGKPASNTIYDFVFERLERVETRLPGFFRADLNFLYRFATGFGHMALSLQWLNLTFSREATKRDCRLDGDFQVRCSFGYQPAIVLPNAGVRAEF